MVRHDAVLVGVVESHRARGERMSLVDMRSILGPSVRGTNKGRASISEGQSRSTFAGSAVEDAPVVEAGMELLSAHPGKRRTEWFWLVYTPIWGAISAVVMVGGHAQRWGDAALLVYGVAMALPALLGPMLFCAPEERALPVHARAGTKFALSVAAFALLLNYSQTPFFFDVLHMHYGFRSTLNIRHNPVFLYLVTIAYFSTYAVLLSICVRVARAAFPRSLGVLSALLACVLVAGLETALNANPFTRGLFCYDDMNFALWFGSLAYGVAFVCVLPVWLALDEPESLPLGHVLAFVCAAVYVDSLVLDVLRVHVAPHFTMVVADANGLGAMPGSCLAPR